MPDASTDHRFPCPACGADLRFDPRTRSLHCDFCGHDENIGEAASIVHPIAEQDFDAAIRDRIPTIGTEDTATTQCQNCGARIIFDGTGHADECPFCASPVVADTGKHRHIKPQALIPFTLTQDDARTALGNWLGSLWFAPNGLRQYARKGRRMNGVYLPYWTFDARTRSAYRGQRGRIHQIRRRGADGKMQTTSTIRWTGVSGQVRRDFDDVLALASNTLPGATVDALEPWDLSALVPYSPDFIAGFRAEAYGIPVEDGQRIARDKMDAVIARDVRLDIGGDRQRIEGIDTRISDVTFKHVLLPIWIAAFSFRGKSYQVVVNGQTGRITGERPFSWWKIAFAVLLALILGAVITYFMNS